MNTTEKKDTASAKTALVIRLSKVIPIASGYRENTVGTLVDSIKSFQKASVAAPQAPENLHFIGADGDNAGLAHLPPLFREKDGRELLEFLKCHSPFLFKLLNRNADFLNELTPLPLHGLKDALLAPLIEAQGFATQQELMRFLRIQKQRIALVTGLCDILGVFSLEDVTTTLSLLAEHACRLALEHLLQEARSKGELPHIAQDNPTKECGIFVLGMGKLGAYELNYSSDIDLIVLFDGDKLAYEGRHSLQHLMNRITRDMVKILHERTEDGYVFRTDIRLRPDPASTPPAISLYAALAYYETVGQNWERAALIKARPIAGDKEAAAYFQKAITPFIWRKNLDFAAIADIHSIKRQIDHRTGGKIRVAGHNVKLGAGGIREIEFFVQVQQLIWGGRKPHLREKATCTMLLLLAKEDIISECSAKNLIESYHFLRMIEHRIQMQRDEQCHSLPEAGAELASFALFAGFPSLQAFEETLLFHLHRVKKEYETLYGTEENLGLEGSLVFTGVEPDPDTLNTLQRLGFNRPENVYELIANWHRGHKRSTRNTRAREILTEITPHLLQAFGDSAHPDEALLKFDEFLSGLPAGVQIFSLFQAKPELLRLIASIMGSAPSLAEILSKNSILLDAVLTGAFYAPLPDNGQLEKELSLLLETRGAYEDHLSLLAQFKNEKHFQAGIHLMEQLSRPETISQFLSKTSDIIINKLINITKKDFEKSYGTINNSQFGLVALGKLGSYELTFASDIDLVFVYHTQEADALSSGARSFTASVYFNRLAQRIIGALTSLTRYGRLYEVDTRLRPLGNDGPLASSLEAFEKYYQQSAWTFERMALTKGRAIYGDDAFRATLQQALARAIRQEADNAAIKSDIAAMREKIARQYPTQNPWEVKHHKGGMIDIEFIAQYLWLTHPQWPLLPPLSAPEVFARAASQNAITETTGKQLAHAHAFQSHVLHILRLCNEGTLNEAQLPAGLKKLLIDQFKSHNFNELIEKLNATIEQTQHHYQHFLGE